jgi:hypothetical protein
MVVRIPNQKRSKGGENMDLQKIELLIEVLKVLTREDDSVEREAVRKELLRLINIK